MTTDVLKTALIGDSFVGKSTLCYAIVDRPINREYTSTIGVDYIVKIVSNDVYIGFWDLAGLDRFATIISSYVKNSKQVIFCYSAESYQSYVNMINKYEFYKTNNYLDDKPIFVVATKIESRKAHYNYQTWSEDFVNINNFPFIPISSYTGEGLEKLTRALVDKKQFLSINFDAPDTVSKIEPSSEVIIANNSPKCRNCFGCCFEI